MKNYAFLKDMYADQYFPKFLVDKIRTVLLEICDYIEKNNSLTKEQETEFIDKSIKKINDLASEFDENDSEIETVAREAILEDIKEIIKHYNLTFDFEEATADRDW